MLNKTEAGYYEMCLASVCMFYFSCGRYLRCGMRFWMSFAYRRSFMPGDAVVGLYNHVNELTREGMDCFIEPLYILSHRI
jgi:hypothetical protein